MKTCLLLALTGLSPLPYLPLSAARPPHPAQDHPSARPKPRPKVVGKAPAYGAKADSLNGIPGHPFGASRSTFPELEARGFNNLDDYVTYALREGQPAPGWFGKHADQVSTTYSFRHDQFASFSASQHAPDGQRQLLAEETLYLFGPGKRTSTAFGQITTQWVGKNVRVEFADGHNEAVLSLQSQPVLAEVAAARRAKHQAEAAARAASLKADNAPAGP